MLLLFALGSEAAMLGSGEQTHVPVLSLKYMQMHRLPCAYACAPPHPCFLAYIRALSHYVLMPYIVRLDECTEENIYGLVNLNALFSLFLNRALLPQLRRAAKSGPVLVNFVGSIAGDLGHPRLAVYAGSKGFLEALARGLDNDELYLNPDGPTGVRYCYLAVAAVHTSNLRAAFPTGFTTPTCERFAKCILDRAGCGRRRVAPYWVHGMMQYFMNDVLSDGVVDKASADQMRGLIVQAKKGE